MGFFRLIAWVLVFLAIALIGADGVTSLEQGEPVIRSTASLLSILDIDGFAIAEAAPAGISQALTTIMKLPLWSVLGIIGIVLTLIFRPIE